jgi:hypothetical protein
METRISLSQVEGPLRAALERAAERSERIVVERDGGALGAFISLEDLRFFEELEDANDVRRARANVEASRRAGEPNVSLHDVQTRVAAATTDQEHLVSSTER